MERTHLIRQRKKQALEVLKSTLNESILTSQDKALIIRAIRHIEDVLDTIQSEIQDNEAKG